MHLVNPITLLLLLLTTTLTLAEDIPITVGASAKLAFNPPIVTATIGDTLTFIFYPKNHSVVRSTFADPCHPLASGFFSGFQPLNAGPGPVEFVVEVKDENPIWIYCSQGPHCELGMNMVVNQPAAPSLETLDAYNLAAAKVNASTSPAKIAGGISVSPNSIPTSPGVSNTSATGSSSGSSSTGSVNSLQASPIAFQGGAGKLSAGVVGMLGVAGMVLVALI